MTTYLQNGYYGGHIIEEDEPESPKICCDLCGEDCTDNFELEAITASLSICVCQSCFNQEPVEYQSALEFLKLKK
jgi:hypothetical protein